ncbi:hypothetical protein SAMN04515647_1330 [Cohaesibacter sp. ES.047]|nr:hypothetical protein SAMN04515647_1330 [Cohaesibacter sp. ES.047]
MWHQHATGPYGDTRVGSNSDTRALRRTACVWFSQPCLVDRLSLLTYALPTCLAMAIKMDYTIAGSLYFSFLDIKAHATRAILLANATVTSILGLRANICPSQPP